MKFNEALEIGIKSRRTVKKALTLQEDKKMNIFNLFLLQRLHEAKNNTIYIKDLKEEIMCLHNPEDKNKIEAGISKNIREIVGRGYASKVQCEADKRSYMIVMTEKGKDKYSEFYEISEKIWEETYND